MTLAELIRTLDSFADELSIYAAPRWDARSRAIAAREPADGSVPELARGMTYLATVAQAKRVLADRRRRRTELATVEELCRALIYFAIYDETEPLASETSGELVLPMAI